MGIENKFPFSTLRNTDQPATLYILKAFLIALIPAMVISAYVTSLQQFELRHVETSTTGFIDFLAVVIVAPVVETIIEIFVIVLLLKYINEKTLVVLISGFLWAFLHSTQLPIWGMTIFWSFIVSAIVCIEFLKYSKRRAFLIATAVHMAQNLTSFTLLAIANTYY
jgi:hypothetical protein